MGLEAAAEVHAEYEERTLVAERGPSSVTTIEGGGGGTATIQWRNHSVISLPPTSLNIQHATLINKLPLESRSNDEKSPTGIGREYHIMW